MKKTAFAWLPALLTGVLVFSLSSADAAPRRQGYEAPQARNSRSMNYSYKAGPRTRIFVTKRSWLDMGTEVKPGERHYLDYALRPGNSDIDMLNPRTDWRRQPLPDPFDLPGYSKTGFPYNNY